MMDDESIRDNSPEAQQLPHNRPHPPGWKDIVKEYKSDARPHWEFPDAINLVLGLRPSRVSYTDDPLSENVFGEISGFNAYWQMDQLEKQYWRVRHETLRASQYGRINALPVSGPLDKYRYLDGRSRETSFPVYFERSDFLAFANEAFVDILVDDFKTQLPKPKEASGRHLKHIQNRDSNWLRLFVIYSRDPEAYSHEVAGSKQPNLAKLHETALSLTESGVFPSDPPMQVYEGLSKQLATLRQALGAYEENGFV